jgi:DNA-binding response OmpR family regulator
VLFVTGGNPDPKGLARVLSPGSVEVLAKPFSTPELVAKARGLVGGPR